MSEAHTQATDAIQLQNASRAREAGWLGFATLMFTMLLYFAALGLLALFWQAVNSTIGGFSVFEIGVGVIFQQFIQNLLPPLVISTLIILFFIFRIGRRKGIGFFHHGESAEGEGFRLYLLLNACFTSTFFLWIICIGDGGELLKAVGFIIGVFIFTGIFNIIPAIVSRYVWARALEWARERWGHSLAQLPEGNS